MERQDKVKCFVVRTRSGVTYIPWEECANQLLATLNDYLPGKSRPSVQITVKTVSAEWFDRLPEIAM